MRQLPASLLLASTALTSACASTSITRTADPWDLQCYPGYGADVLVLSGIDAVDCGVLPRRGAPSGSSSPQECLASALVAEKPFRVGHASHGYDSLFCDAVVRAQDGTIWSVFYDFDVTGQMRSDGGAAALWVSRCARVAMEPGTIGPGSFFHAVGCSEDKTALSRILEARNDHSR
jgi:hypothetical protein